MKDIKIEWKKSGIWTYGTAITRSGKRASIGEAVTKKGRYWTVFIEGDERHAATRANLGTVYKILETR